MGRPPPVLSDAKLKELGFKRPISSFFTPPPPPAPKPGRPVGTTKQRFGPKPAQSAGKPAATAASPALPVRGPTKSPPQHPAAAKSSTPATTATKDIKGSRVNYSKGEPLERLQKAVDDWLGKKGTYLTEGGMTLSRFCALAEIPKKTFQSYVCEDESRRRTVGVGVGNAKRLLQPDTEEFLVDMMRRRDRANDGMDRRAGISMLQDLQPELSSLQAQTQFDRVLRPAHKDVLTGIVKAEATTTKRSAITVEQQYRWHSTVDGSFAFLRANNTGTTPDGRTFGEVMPHFILGGDETCLLASNGEVKIIGDKEKKKHEVQTLNSRNSITLYRSGSAAGNDGPTAFLPPGVPSSPPLLPSPCSPSPPLPFALPAPPLTPTRTLLHCRFREVSEGGLRRRLPQEAWRSLRLDHCNDGHRLHDRGCMGRNLVVDGRWHPCNADHLRQPKLVGREDHRRLRAAYIIAESYGDLPLPQDLAAEGGGRRVACQPVVRSCARRPRCANLAPPWLAPPCPASTSRTIVRAPAVPASPRPASPHALTLPPPCRESGEGGQASHAQCASLFAGDLHAHQGCCRRLAACARRASVRAGSQVGDVD